jgi:hypothetical protein
MSGGIILIIFITFLVVLAIVSGTYGWKITKMYINGVIDMGFPKNMNVLHVSAYYGDVNNVLFLLKVRKWSPDSIMEDGNTGRV